jgi:LysM repeat protein
MLYTMTYKVQTGDNLQKIGKRFSNSIYQILYLNPQIEDPNQIFPGQELEILDPLFFVKYYVQRGDNLNNIAEAFKMTIQEIMFLNTDVTNPNNIYVGQLLVLMS